MKLSVVMLICAVLLTGCFSSNVSHSEEFRSHLSKNLTLQRDAYLYPSQYMKSIMWGDMVNTYFMTEEDTSHRGITKIPAGTSVKIKRIERRNLIDSGIEILAFGALQFGETNTEFVFELTSDLGREIRRAPWESDAVPLLRPAYGSGWVDIHVAPPHPK